MNPPDDMVGATLRKANRVTSISVGAVRSGSSASGTDPG